MLYALGFIGLFTIGGLTGLFLACLAFDVHATDTYFVVAHFHYIMVGGMVTAYFGGLHYWWPKITGRLYSESWARAAAILMFFGFNLTFFPQFVLGCGRHAAALPRLSAGVSDLERTLVRRRHDFGSRLPAAAVLPRLFPVFRRPRAGKSLGCARARMADAIAATGIQFRRSADSYTRSLSIFSGFPGGATECLTEAFAPQFASVRHRDDTAELGMWVFIATEVLLFGGLLLAYLVYRHAYPQAFMAASRRTDIMIGTANTAILLTSSFLVASAVEAYAADVRTIRQALLIGAIFLGLLFMTLKWVEYADDYREHLIPGINFAFDGRFDDGAELFFVFYFVATALHALHMLVGICLLATFAVLTRNAANSRTNAALHSAALYWHFVDVVWIFLFALIYLPGRPY